MEAEPPGALSSRATQRVYEGEHILEWWVLTQQGDLVAKVQMPEDLSLEWLMFEPLIAIKGDFFYVSKKDPDTEQELVVKYKMEYQ